jgi:hypothetical protein
MIAISNMGYISVRDHLSRRVFSYTPRDPNLTQLESTSLTIPTPISPFFFDPFPKPSKWRTQTNRGSLQLRPAKRQSRL